MKPITKPTTGEISIGLTSFGQSPVLHLSASHPAEEVATAAPQSPPTSAWLELDGRPNHQVNRFQMMAPSSAASTVPVVTTLGSTKSLLMDLATATPVSAPNKLVQAASRIALRGVSTLVETTVAIALAVSWNPLMNSKTKAAMSTQNSSVSMAAGQEYFSTIWNTTLPASRQRSMARSSIS